MRKLDTCEPIERNMNECWNTCLLDHEKKLVVMYEWAFKIFCMESVLCVYLTSNSILHYQLLDPWQTVIAQLTCLNEALQEERCFYSLWSWPVILLVSMGWEVLQYMVYSLDIFQAIHLFWAMKCCLSGQSINPKSESLF